MLSEVREFCSHRESSVIEDRQISDCVWERLLQDHGLEYLIATSRVNIKPSILDADPNKYEHFRCAICPQHTRLTRSNPDPAHGSM